MYSFKKKKSSKTKWHLNSQVKTKLYHKIENWSTVLKLMYLVSSHHCKTPHTLLLMSCSEVYSCRKTMVCSDCRWWRNGSRTTCTRWRRRPSPGLWSHWWLKWFYSGGSSDWCTASVKVWGRGVSVLPFFSIFHSFRCFLWAEDKTDATLEECWLISTSLRISKYPELLPSLPCHDHDPDSESFPNCYDLKQVYVGSKTVNCMFFSAVFASSKWPRTQLQESPTLRFTIFTKIISQLSFFCFTLLCSLLYKFYLTLLLSFFFCA